LESGLLLRKIGIVSNGSLIVELLKLWLNKR
jgi:hypothetical protein